ncbi:MAG: post-transcriptional regulator [Paenibacillaceae bacterium]|nr:post-transcriptional regulator [Paenibacillaceae bacterium]
MEDEGREVEQVIGQDEAKLNAMIEELCISKAKEFRLIGYEHVTGEDIWDCVNEKYKKNGDPALHKVVNDILSLKSTQFMNWMTLSVYRGPLK